MKKLALVIALTIFLTTSVQQISMAQDIPHPGKSPNHTTLPGKGVGLAKKLNLSEEQSIRARQLREHSRDEIRPVIDKLRYERAKLRKMLETNTNLETNTDTEEIRIQKGKVQLLMNQVKEIHKQNLENFEQILTSDQKTRFEEIKKERKNKMNGRKGNFHKNKPNKKFEKSDREFD